MKTQRSIGFKPRPILKPEIELLQPRDTISQLPENRNARN